MKQITSGFIFTLLFTSQVYAWTWNADFECGDLGEHIGIKSGCGIANRQLSSGSDTFVHDGHMSLEMGVKAGTTGDNDWGGHFSFGNSAIPNGKNLGEGDELWYRTWYYFPNGFDFAATGKGLKLSRVHTSTSSGSNDGYLYMVLRDGIGMINEIDHESFGQDNKAAGGSWNHGVTVPTGEWHSIEFYLKFSETPGKGKWRVWQNGNLIFENLTTRTLKSRSSVVDSILFFTYWNGDAPKSQKAYVDDMIFTTETPSNRDSYGNPFIGIGDVERVSRPNPPTLLQ